MKRIIFLILTFPLWLIPSCKKDDNKHGGATHNIKYEVKGFLDLNITYDGTTIFAGKTSNWDYTFTASSGKSLSLSAHNDLQTQPIEVSIYQDGVKTRTANGNGIQSVADVVK